MIFLRHLSRMVIPQSLRACLRNIRTLEIDYNHFYTAQKWTCVDRGGDPIPWYTYPAIEYLRQLDFSCKDIFEYGCGNSTLFWAKRARTVISVEDNSDWARNIARQAPPNVEIRLVQDVSAFTLGITDYPQDFDVIVIDGEYERCKCSQMAIQKLKPGGMIILDNSDHYTNTARVLRGANLIQVDMTGFGPMQGVTWTTSFFLRRDFDFEPIGSKQPLPGIGSYVQSPEERHRHEGDC